VPQVLQGCAAALVDHLGAAFARIWTLNADENVLELQASAGLYTHRDGPHGRVPVGQFKIGLIAQERQPHLTNAVIGDPRVGDQDWARREGMVAFAGYPLLVEGQLVGVMAMFAREPLPEETLELLALIADIIAQGIERRRAEEDLRRLSARLEQQVVARTEDLRQANARLHVELVEREQAEAALRQATAEAERANQAKSEFLSRTSHELRTPLNAILGFGQLLEMDNLTLDQTDNLAQIMMAGRHLLDLINEVLDIARIDTGQLSISREPVPLADVVQESLALIAPLAHAHQIQVTVDASIATDQHVLADRQRLKQVLLNLLTNAVKYNHERGSVDIACAEAEPGWRRLTVCDSGPGIAAEQIDRLFTPFDRLGAEQTEVEGTGLGLAVSKRLVDAMGGRLGVVSTPGQGSSFWVDLAEVDGPIAQHERLPSASAAAPAVASTFTHTVLYVEDNPSNLRLIERLLATRPALRLLTAMQGRLGLALAQEHRPDLILLDVHLSDLTGAQVLHQLQADPATRAIPVVVLSADATAGQIERLLAAGARAYLTKPLDLHKFLELLDTTLQELAAI
jgi:signal transduction histidine kinase/ActR/RegA family two-component response regulator